MNNQDQIKTAKRDEITAVDKAIYFINQREYIPAISNLCEALGRRLFWMGLEYDQK